MVIKKIDLGSIEKSLKNIVETSSQARLMQDQLEAILTHLENNEKYFKVFSISRNTYEKNRIKFEKEKNVLSSEISKSTNGLLKDIGKLERKIAKSKI